MMENLNAAQVSSLYGLNTGEYGGGGGDGGVNSMMALITQNNNTQHDGDGIVTGSFSSFHGPAECLLSAAMFHADKIRQFVPETPTESVVKTEDYPNNVESRFEFQTERARDAVLELVSTATITPFVSHGPEANAPHHPTPNEAEADAMKAKILAHPQYSCMLEAYIDCQKVGAPPEVVARLDTAMKKYESRRNRTTTCIGMDPELDRFMEAYCEMLSKYHEELSKPFNEAMAFVKKIETQLNFLSKGTVRVSSPAENDEKTEEGGSSDEEDCSTGEMDYQEVDPHLEDRELKEHLLRKYSGYLSSLKQEFTKKKKKGKLPKDARQKLLDWWHLHFKWPYPSENEKIALAESTGLDQKQINNWFINQRKRHWKPVEDKTFIDGHGAHSGAVYVDRHVMGDGTSFHFDC